MPSLPSIPQNGISSFPIPDQVQSNIPTSPQPLQPHQTSSNPFRQSVMPTGGSGSSLPPTRQATNPFARSAMAPQPSQQQPSNAFTNQMTSPVSASSPFASAPPQSQHGEFQTDSSIFSPPPQSTTPATSALQPQRTGTNPFARNRSPQIVNAQFPPAASSPLLASPTGNNNPFRHTAD